MLYMDELSYFGLVEHPFRIGPDPRFLYFSEQVKEAVAKCEYMAEDRTGPIYIYGPIGSGKTSLLRRLNERNPASRRRKLRLGGYHMLSCRTCGLLGFPKRP